MPPSPQAIWFLCHACRSEARGRRGLGAKAMSRDPEEERFARGNSRRYSGWSSAFVIVAILVVLAIVFLAYELKY
jgi:hypothetical protein